MIAGRSARSAHRFVVSTKRLKTAANSVVRRRPNRSTDAGSFAPARVRPGRGIHSGLVVLRPMCVDRIGPEGELGVLHEFRVWKILRGSVVISTIAIAVGITCAISGAVTSIFHPTLGARLAGRLVYLSSARPGRTLTWQEYDQARGLVAPFSGVANYTSDESIIQYADETIVARGEVVSSNYFEVLNPRFLLGRPFTEEDVKDGSEPPVVVSAGFWRRHLGGSLGAIGRALRVSLPSPAIGSYLSDATQYQVVGVADGTFRGLTGGLRAADYWLPLESRAADYDRVLMVRTRTDRRYVADMWRGYVVARLRAGVGIKDAAAAVTNRVGPSGTPSTAAAGTSIRVRRDPEAGTFLRGPGALAPEWLQGALLALEAVLIAVALTNLGGMVRRQAVSHARDIAVRRAMGASWARILGEVFAAGFFVAALGAALGYVLAEALLRTFAVTIPLLSRDPGFAEQAPARFTADVPLAFGVLAALTVFIGMVSVARLRRVKLAALLVGQGLGRRLGSRPRISHTVLIPQVVVCTLLTVVAGGAVRRLLAATASPVGYKAGEVLVADVQLPTRLDATVVEHNATRLRYNADLAGLLARLPGVRSFAFADAYPEHPLQTWLAVRFNGAPADYRWVARADVSHRYFDVMGMTVLAGRGFSADDEGANPRIAIVSADLARLIFPGQSAVGRVITLHAPNTEFRVEWLDVVGVVGTVSGATGASIPFVYLPLTEPQAYVMLRVDSGVPNLPPAIKKTLLAPMAGTLLTRETSLANELLAERYPQEVTAWILISAAVISIFLAAAGLYSALSYATMSQMHELGIRAALGASPWKLARFVIWQGLRPVCIGVLLGAGATPIVARVVGALGVAVATPTAVTIVSGSAAVAAAAVVALWGPARLARRAAPSELFRVQ
jgi:putative ABC transport system permease protein